MSDAVFNLKIFEWIDKIVIQNILDNCEEENFAAWEIIIREWEESNKKWYIIKSWKVKVSVKNTEISILWDWEIFWEIALLNEESRTATVEALEDTKTIVLTLDNLVDMINNDDNKINKEIIRRIEETYAK